MGQGLIYLTDASQPTCPIYTSGTLLRTGEALATVVGQFDVENNPRYTPRDGNTYCNIFLWDVTKALGCEIPHTKATYTNVNGTVVFKAEERNANRTIDWLINKGSEWGWRQVSKNSALDRVNGVSVYPTVAVWRNPNDAKPGHVALLVPSPVPTAVYITQSGASNFKCKTLESGFGSLPVVFFTHD